MNAQFKVYLANQPNFEDLTALSNVKALSIGEIYAIGQTCGNGWRKVFNVYAKLVFALNMPSLVSLNDAESWQDYRDKHLLQVDSNTSLLFSAPDLSKDTGQCMHIVMGRTYAKSLDLPYVLTWLDNEFAIDKSNNLVVCPYFDYRQLSNLKIIRLVELIKSFVRKT